METSGFFNADLVEGEYDRVYLAEQFAEYFSRFISNGVFGAKSTELQVTASSPESMKVKLNEGSAFINGYWYSIVDAPLELTLPNADGALSRVDSVMLQLNYKDRVIKAVVKSGKLSSEPSYPEDYATVDRDINVYELKVADILVKPGAIKISDADITDTRFDNFVCGIVTGLVDQIDTTDLFKQYQKAFDTWFEDIKGKLTEDAAGNLQSQIGTLPMLSTEAKDTLVNALNEVNEKVNEITNNVVASISDLIRVEDEGKYVDAKVVKEILDALTPEFLYRPDQFSNEVPSDVDTNLAGLTIRDDGWYTVGVNVNAPGKVDGKYLIVNVREGENWSPIEVSSNAGTYRTANEMTRYYTAGTKLKLNVSHNVGAPLKIMWRFWVVKTFKDIIPSVG